MTVFGAAVAARIAAVENMAKDLQWLRIRLIGLQRLKNYWPFPTPFHLSDLS
ncbi:MAG: hypothetical protein MK098_13905 [Marinovum sp.]|nr:hypothetical protein [Marinovum sp.]